MIEVTPKDLELLRKIKDGFATRGTSELRLKIEQGNVEVFTVEIHKIKQSDKQPKRKRQ